MTFLKRRNKEIMHAYSPWKRREKGGSVKAKGCIEITGCWLSDSFQWNLNATIKWMSFEKHFKPFYSPPLRPDFLQIENSWKEVEMNGPKIDRLGVETCFQKWSQKNKSLNGVCKKQTTTKQKQKMDYEIKTSES